MFVLGFYNLVQIIMQKIRMVKHPLNWLKVLPVRFYLENIERMNFWNLLGLEMKKNKRDFHQRMQGNDIADHMKPLGNWFLVPCTQLYKPLCWLVGWSLIA